MKSQKIVSIITVLACLFMCTGYFICQEQVYGQFV